MISNPWISKTTPWISQPLTEAAKDAKLRAVLSIASERVIYGNQAIIVSWTIFLLGVAMIVGASLLVVSVLPLKTIQNEIWVADQSTGIINHPVRMEDAARTFGAATEQHYLRQYIEARDRWVPELDQENDHIAKVMSSPEEQARINATRLEPNSNPKALGKDAHAVLENFHYVPQAMDKDSQTRRYWVHFTHTVWRGNNKETTEPWTATVEFQWHPEREMKPADREINPGGFVTIAYTAHSDLADNRRQ